MTTVLARKNPVLESAVLPEWAVPALPSAGAGVDADLARSRLLLWGGRLADDSNNLPSAIEAKQGQLARYRFILKSHVAAVAMHLDAEWRTGLFRQLDLIFDRAEAGATEGNESESFVDDEWDPDEPLPDLESWKTLVRMIIFFRFQRRPGLSVYDGHFIASWDFESFRVSVEALRDDEIRFVASRDIVVNGAVRREAAAGDTVLKRLPENLVAFEVGRWLLNADNAAAG